MLLNSSKPLLVQTLAFSTLGFEDFMNAEAIHAAMTGEALHVGDFFFLMLTSLMLINPKSNIHPDVAD